MTRAPSPLRWHAWLVPEPVDGRATPIIPAPGEEGEDLRHCPRSAFATAHDFVAWLRREMPSTAGRTIRIYGQRCWSLHMPQTVECVA